MLLISQEQQDLSLEQCTPHELCHIQVKLIHAPTEIYSCTETPFLLLFKKKQ